MGAPVVTIDHNAAQRRDALVGRLVGSVLGAVDLSCSRVSQFLLIMFRLRPRLRGRPGFLAGWPAQGMGGEIWRR
jgi:hypothetical protein